jgi:hypothetical protein
LRRGQPRRGASGPLALSARKAFQSQNSLVNPLTFLPQFDHHFQNVHVARITQSGDQSPDGSARQENTGVGCLDVNGRDDTVGRSSPVATAYQNIPDYPDS